jgi:hypothetical protein
LGLSGFNVKVTESQFLPCGQSERAFFPDQASVGRFRSAAHPFNSFNDPDHPFGVLTAILLKLLSDRAAFIIGNIAESYSQKFEARLPALLNFQIGIAAPSQDRQYRFDGS